MILPISQKVTEKESSPVAAMIKRMVVISKEIYANEC